MSTMEIIRFIFQKKENLSTTHPMKHTKNYGILKRAFKRKTKVKISFEELDERKKNKTLAILTALGVI